MSRDPDGLLELLPQWHRLRDAEAGEPLRALLAVVAEQVDVVRSGIEQGYQDWFVETAADWAVAYLGDLVGYRILPGYEEVLATGLHGGASPERVAARDRLAARLAPRHDVANTVAYRRRKGTLALLEELSASVADWPARAVELSRLLGGTQPVRLLRPDEEAADRRRLSRGGWSTCGAAPNSTCSAGPSTGRRTPPTSAGPPPPAARAAARRPGSPCTSGG